MGVKLGFIGFGIMGERLLRAALAHDPARLVVSGIYDPSANAAQRLAAISTAPVAFDSAAAVIAAGVPAIAGFQSWNGWRWGRWAGLLAVALTGGFAALTHDWGFVAVGLAVVGSALLWLPPVSRYLADWDRVRAERPVPYRRPESIFYGRLPRFR